MNGSHITGTGIGGIVGVVLAALGSKIGLHLTDADAATLGLGCAGLGLAVGHAFGKAWQGAGVFPSISRGLFGQKTASAAFTFTYTSSSSVPMPPPIPAAPASPTQP